jgi:hypothetical protein
MSGLQERGSVELPSPRVSCCAVRSAARRADDARGDHRRFGELWRWRWAALPCRAARTRHSTTPGVVPARLVCARGKSNQHRDTALGSTWLDVAHSLFSSS